MKHNIWKSLRMKLVLYGTASLLLAGATEGILAMLLYLMSTVLGVSRQNSVYDYSSKTSGHTDEYLAEGISGVKGSLLRNLENIGNDTLYTIVVVGLAVGLLLFILYFLLFVPSANVWVSSGFSASQISDGYIKALIMIFALGFALVISFSALSISE